MADFVRYELEGGSEVYFESTEGSLVSLRGGSPDVAGFEGHTETVTRAMALPWPGLDHSVLVTTGDRTARIWDPQRPDRELARLTIFGEVRSVVALDDTTLAVASSRGFLIFELSADGTHKP
jgi:hypothetical protein